jgi:GTP diphosphokinase / guanosine-3',5'-bis(diphosphate) 3'-diphosphatase
MNALKPEEEKEIQLRFNDLLKKCVHCDSPDDKRLIEKAFKIAFEAHKEMRRRSGEPYIIHPLSVARIVNEEMGLGVKSIVSALLHDVVEDTDYTLEEIERNFGPKIASIIDGLTKIGELYDNNSSLQAENFRKMLLTLSDDVRVILIKLADRLHNMRTLESLPREKQNKIASETIYIYAPLAHRLGLYSIKTELEDLSLKFRFPEKYTELKKKVEESEPERAAFIQQFAEPIKEKLDKQSMNYEITSRTKSVYSIWNKTQTKHIPFEEIYDLFALRIIFEPIPDIPEKTQCWNIYSIITDIYTPKPERIRDWVSTPKANGYEALHMTVMSPMGRWVEIQIRSRRMDEIAEKGFAAHWKYKQSNAQENELDKWLRKIRELLQDPNSNALEFLDDFKLNLFSSEIHVFTPKGELKTLPKDSTALDFAFEIHSQIGNKAIGAKVNHRLVPLNYKLTNGDQVEIITSDKQRFQKDWLDFVLTAKAKTAIKNSLKSETKNRIEKGKTMLENKLKELNLNPSSRIFQKIVPAYEVSNKEELYSKIGSEMIKLDELPKILKRNSKNKWIRYWELTLGLSNENNIGEEEKEVKEIKDVKDVKDIKVTKRYTRNSPYILRENINDSTSTYSIAKCCNPIPGEDVIGYRNIYNSIIIHKSKCPNAVKLLSSQSDRIVPTKWTTHKILSFLVKINIQGIDRFGVFNNITSSISKDLSINIRTINIASHDGIFEGTLELYVHSVNDLHKLVVNLEKIKGVEKVSRIENIEE